MRRMTRSRACSAVVVLVLAAGCSKSEPTQSAQPAQTAAPARPDPTKDPAAARKLIAEGAVVLDVRTPEEFADGHLPNATNIPHHRVAANIADVDKLVGADKGKPIVLYCASGGRASQARQALQAAGYSNVVNGGGYDDLH
jgi:rhodanese-related sulfurtransferase